MGLSFSPLRETIFCGQGWVAHCRPARQGKKRNAFKYPIMNVLVPICGKTESLIKDMERESFFSLDCRQYLSGRVGSFESLIRGFLRDNLQYEPDQIWLQTLPKMWGYSFNPVSFWLCFKEQKLDAVLCEVNNTFGDRHYYFMKDLWQRQGLSTTLPKQFHVSPFFPTDGDYSFEFNLTDEVSEIGIQYFKDEILNLDTRIKLSLSPLSEVSKWTLLRRYGWLSIMVIVRIHLQALKLWKKRLPFFRRPAPPEEKISL